MDRRTTVADLVDALRREVEHRQMLISELEARLGAEHETPRRTGTGAAAVEILRSAGRPMHGLGEIVPALRAAGHEVRSTAGFATLLLRTGKVRRTAPGTFAFAPSADGG